MDSLYAKLTPLAKRFITEFSKDRNNSLANTLSVSPIVSDIARWYEKLRNAMENHEEEIIIRTAIERILKRRLLFDKKGKNVAEPLIRELLWARYFQENTISEELIETFASKIDLYIILNTEIRGKHKISREKLNSWLLEILSADLARTIHPDRENELVANFMYHILRGKITVKNEDEETGDIQTFLAVRKSLLKEDRAFLRYNLFLQYFGEVTEKSLPEISQNFLEGYKRIEETWDYPLKNRIFAYVKKNTPPFLILRQVLYGNRGNLQELLGDTKKFDEEVMATCTYHYKTILRKVRRALIRSIIFLFATKVIIAVLVEGTYEQTFYGQISYLPLVINILTPPLLMVIAMFFIRPPGEKNSERILEIIHSLLTEKEATQIRPISLDIKQTTSRFYVLFLSLWFISAATTISLVVWVLTTVGMHTISQVLFVFFIATASFLAYRINQASKVYQAYEGRQSILTALFDFMFMPIIYLGRRFAEGVSKFNIFILVFDFLIEMPLKSIFAFSEEWLLFLRYQKEKLD